MACKIYCFVLCILRLLQNPSDYMQSLSDAVTELTRQVDHKYLKEGEQVLVGFEGPFVSRRVTPRDLLSSFIGSMVCVEGIVTKCTFFSSSKLSSLNSSFLSLASCYSSYVNSYVWFLIYFY